MSRIKVVKGQNVEIKPCTDEYNLKNVWKANIKMQRAIENAGMWHKKTDRGDIWSPGEGFRLKHTSQRIRSVLKTSSGTWGISVD